MGAVENLLVGAVDLHCHSGVAERDIRLMVRDNPARLIGLDA